MIFPDKTVLELLHGDHAAVFMGVHNAMGAKIAEEAGADGLWISSFEVHTAARLPDADILGTGTMSTSSPRSSTASGSRSLSTAMPAVGTRSTRSAL